ncbi:MAG: cupin domain-containing protein [Thermoleophilia bacterium]|nr:cupin domain-containing protein [Thermoleophilia bacterium]
MHDGLLGVPVNLADVVEVQSGAVVSKEIIRTEQGTVTAFAFDARQGLSEHTAPFDALVIALQGEVEIIIDGTPHKVAAGQMIIMPAHRPHALRALSPFKMLLVMIRAPKAQPTA